MFKMKLTLVAAVALAAFTASAATPPPTLLLTKRTEAQLIAVLKSDAPLKDKADACRELGVIGTKECVPVLATMLADENQNHIARYALEPNPDPSVNEVLRAALATAKGRPLVGVIGSLGVRRDAQAVGSLAPLLLDADADVAQAAARALGKIGGVPASMVLSVAVEQASAGNQLAFCEGLFRCAESFSATGDRAHAQEVYDVLLTKVKNAPHQVRAGALRGSIVLNPEEGLVLLAKALQGDDWIMVAAAARAAIELSGTAVTQTVAAELGKGSADKQILVAQVLGKRADAAALPALFAVAKSGDKNVRIAAIRALPEIGRPTATPVLVELLKDTDREIAQTAQDSLAALPGNEVDAAVLAMLSSGDTAQRLTAIDLLSRRRMTKNLPELLKLTSDADAKVRSTALKRVGELGGPADVPALLDSLMKAKDSQALEAAEQAVSTICVKAGDADACADKIGSLLTQAPPEQKGALLRVLGAIGGQKSLQLVRAAVNDANADVHSSAIRVLGDWKTADAAPDLLALAKNASDPKDKMLCLRSYLGLARNPDFPAPQRLTMCRDAAGMVQSQDEKRLLLSALGSVQSPEAINVILPYLEDASTKNEAAAAALGIADRLLQGRNAARNAARLVEPLQKVAKSGANADLVKRAQTLLKQAQAKPAAK